MTQVARLDPADPQDAQRLVSSGLGWRGGPRMVQTLLRQVVSGAVVRNEAKEPPEVTAYLSKVLGQGVDATGQQPEQETPVEDAAEPGEEAPNAPTA